ncbi:hypothetical protein, partial [Allokutzneria sp. NRRL B-24872]|uniref:hypothetical protein n=1 Tax=Allokutzneria sp. NRRL B-24872 TaxID=1137961 RepID=UPI0011781E91
MPLGDMTHHISEMTPAQRAAIVGCVRQWRRKLAGGLEAPKRFSRTVPVTTGQWREVLADSDVVAGCMDLDDSISEVVAVSSLPVKDIGRSLFRRLDRMLAAHGRIDRALVTVARFVPPDELDNTARILEELRQTADEILRTMVACAANGLDTQHWDTALELIARRDDLREDLFADPSLVDAEESRFERVLGLSTAAMNAGDGLSFASRLTAAWLRQPKVLDTRLRTQLPHLLNTAETLTNDVRIHLAALLVREYPLSVHAAAAA